MHNSAKVYVRLYEGKAELVPGHGQVPVRLVVSADEGRVIEVLKQQVNGLYKRVIRREEDRRYYGKSEKEIKDEGFVQIPIQTL